MLADFIHDEPWLTTAGVALAAVVAALVLHRVLGAILRRALRGHTPVLHAMLLAAEPAAAAALPLLALQFVWSSAPSTLPYILTVQHVNVVLLIATFTWFLMSIVTGVADGVIALHPTDVADNLEARRIETQARVLSRSAQTLVLIAGAAVALMTFPGARQLGASLLASAGVIGIIGGLAARPVFSNLIAGLQIALAQPIRMGDVLIVKGEWGIVEEITGTYVVFRIWDERRLIVPLTWFIENPFENWTRTTSQLMGYVMLHLDYAAPMEALREHARKVVEAAPEWDRRVFVVQVVEATPEVMQVRVLMSAINAGTLFDLRCRVREELITFLAREHPESLPRVRQINEQPQARGDTPR
jgi:small-conductance mechanosensitive channel